jgi:hypothetical protein
MPTSHCQPVSNSIVDFNACRCFPVVLQTAPRSMHLQEVATLDHEVFDHAVEGGVLVPLRLLVGGSARPVQLSGTVVVHCMGSWTVRWHARPACHCSLRPTYARRCKTAGNSPLSSVQRLQRAPSSPGPLGARRSRCLQASEASEASLPVQVLQLNTCAVIKRSTHSRTPVNTAHSSPKNTTGFFGFVARRCHCVSSGLAMARPQDRTAVGKCLDLQPAALLV